MIFVKIEVYLMNFYQIYQHYHFPLVKTAFDRIRHRANTVKTENNLKAFKFLAKLKKTMTTLDKTVQRKRIGALGAGFFAIKRLQEVPQLQTSIKKLKLSQIKTLKEKLIEKKQEIEQLTLQAEESKRKGELAGSLRLNSVNRSRDGGITAGSPNLTSGLYYNDGNSAADHKQMQEIKKLHMKVRLA